MTAGLPADGPDGPPDWLYTDDWVASIVEHGTDQPPGEGFAYSSVTSHLLAAAVDQATPGSLLDYARKHLFDPLDIDTRPAAQPPSRRRPPRRREYERAAFAWPTDPGPQRGLYVPQDHRPRHGQAGPAVPQPRTLGRATRSSPKTGCSSPPLVR